VADLDRARQLVEATLTKLGLDPRAARVREDAAQLKWTAQRGSASVLLAVLLRDGVPHLRVIAPVLYPDPAKREALFTRLLELNAGGLAHCAFGLVGERVVAVHERPFSGLDEGEVEHIIRQVSAVADTYDDRLVKEFGGRRASDKQ
jgi:hypothetical protein